MLGEQLVRATVQAAVASGAAEPVVRIVDVFLANSAPGLHVPRHFLVRPDSPLWETGCAAAVAVGLDEPWVEGMGHVPWYAD